MRRSHGGPRDMAGLVILLTLLGIILCTSAGLGVDSRDPSFSLWPLRRLDPGDAADNGTSGAGGHQTPSRFSERRRGCRHHRHYQEAS